MQGLGITMAMVGNQFLEVGLNTLVKAATSNGMSQFVFNLYSNALALCFLLPSTFLYHRITPPPPISTSIICRILLLSLIFSATLTLAYTGIRLSSPTLYSAMVDLVPAFTFIIAIVFRMENVDIKLGSSLAKCMGTVVSITGALTVTLYKGTPITILPLPVPHKQPRGDVVLLRLSQQSNWLLGGFLLAVSSFCSSVTVILVSWIMKDYPAELMLATISCSFVVVLSAIIALVAERNPKAWTLRPDMELIAIVYSAIFFMSIRNVVGAWACRKKGPVFVAMFNPLGLVIALGMGVIFLGDTLYLGSIIGATIIAIGFYCVMWGIAQEEKMVNQKNNEICGSVSSSATPLLESRIMDA